MKTNSLPMASAVCFLAASVTCPAAFFDLGTSGWEYDAPGNVGIGQVSTAGANTTFSLSVAAWNGLEPLSIMFQTKNGVTQFEQFFWMNMDLTASQPWRGFKFSFDDAFDPIEGNAFHPIWAHIHPGNPMSDYKEFNALTPPGGAGVPSLLATGTPINTGDRWLPTNIRLHDMSSTAYTTGDDGRMKFTMTLMPVGVPDHSSTLALLLMGAASLGPVAWKRRGLH